MLKKFGAVAIGVGAGLVAMAPLASAGEAPQDPGDGGHSHSHGHGHGHHNFTSKCDFKGGHANAISDISGDAGLAGNIVASAPVGGNNALNLLDCSSFLNHNVNHNLSNNNLSLFGDNALVD